MEESGLGLPLAINYLNNLAFKINRDDFQNNIPSIYVFLKKLI